MILIQVTASFRPDRYLVGTDSENEPEGFCVSLVSVRINIL